MGVRAAARLDFGDGLGVGEVGGIEDPDAAQPVMADRIRDSLSPAVRAAVQRFARHEQEVAIHRDVALRSGTYKRLEEARNLGIRDVPDLDAVEIALNDVVAADRGIGIDKAEIACRLAS